MEKELTLGVGIWYYNIDKTHLDKAHIPHQSSWV